MALLLERHDAVQQWRSLLGPGDPSVGRASDTHRESVRARWGVNKQANAAHGADSSEAAAREIGFVFGPEWVSPSARYRSREVAISRPECVGPAAAESGEEREKVCGEAARGGARRHGTLQCVLHSSTEAAGEKYAMLEALLSAAGIAGQPTSVSEMSAGFCNWVFKVEMPSTQRSPLVVKSFSPLAKLRLSPPDRGLGDETAAVAGLGPELLYRSPEGLIADFVRGKTLSESDMHADTSPYPALIAPCVAALHRLRPKGADGLADSAGSRGASGGRSSVLWLFLDRMLDHIATDVSTMPRGISLEQV